MVKKGHGERRGNMNYSNEIPRSSEKNGAGARVRVRKRIRAGKILENNDQMIGSMIHNI